MSIEDHLGSHSQNNYPSPIDITKIEPNNAVESYVSASYSSTRLRLSNSSSFLLGAEKDAVSNSPTILTRLRHNYPGLPRILQAAWDFGFFHWGDSGGAYLGGNSGRTNSRHDHSWLGSLPRNAFLAYCFCSCLFVLSRLYAHTSISLSESYLGEGPSPPPFGVVNAKGVSRYLAISAGSTIVDIEPFILSDNIPSRITVCAWIHETELSRVGPWLKNWNSSVSLLVTSTSSPGSSHHRELLNTVQRVSKTWPRSGSGISLHILHKSHHKSEFPNLYLNLAKLFSRSDWAVLFPGDVHQDITPNLNQAALTVDLERQAEVHVLNSRSSVYPFAALSPLMLPTNYDFWCTEKMLMPLSRVSDWNECLWQASLETLGKLKVVGQPGPKPKEIIVTSEESPSTRRTNAKLRGEMCDAFLRQIATTHPRGRYKELAVDWVKSFCLKTVNRKLSR